MGRVPPPPRPNPDLVQCAMCQLQVRAEMQFCDMVHVPMFQASGERRTFLNTIGHGDAPVPHMHRICTHCGYEWTEDIA